MAGVGVVVRGAPSSTCLLSLVEHLGHSGRSALEVRASLTAGLERARRERPRSLDKQ